MEGISKNTLLSESYTDVIKHRLHELGDDILSGNVDLLCKYIVLRFLQTSPDIEVATREDVIAKLGGFLDDIWPFVIALVHVVNSSPFRPSTSKLFGTIMEDSEA